MEEVDKMLVLCCDGAVHIRASPNIAQLPPESDGGRVPSGILDGKANWQIKFLSQRQSRIVYQRIEDGRDAWWDREYLKEIDLLSPSQETWEQGIPLILDAHAKAKTGFEKRISS